MPPLLGSIAKSDCANPVLEIFIVGGNQLKDPFILEFAIFKGETAAERLTPVKTFPVGPRQTVDLTDCPTGDRLGLGHFVADVDAGVDLSGVTGRLVIKWFYKLTATDTEKVVETEFEVLAGTDIGIPFLSYAMVRDLRAQGINITTLPDGDALLALREAAQLVESATGQFFTPRRSRVRYDGNNGRDLLLDQTIIAIEQIDIINQSILGASQGPIELDDVFVYNRHLSQRLFQPDDRESPKISFFRDTDMGGFIDPNKIDLLFRNRLIFPLGTQNIELTAVWGYTDPNPFRVDDKIGITPLAIRKVCMKIALRESTKIGDTDALVAQNKGPIKSERTLQQAVTYGTSGNDSVARGSGITGDASIDVILAQYARPVPMASV